MPTGQQGSIRLFRFSGVDVFLHWTWFLVALFEINARSGSYSSVTWNVLEYLGLFLIVLLHEYGHALACRSVGGVANQIVLWPLGGVAYVNPPPRPGATLWSIAAGPLVNVVLFPILLGIGFLSRSAGGPHLWPNAHALLRTIFGINVILLVFNVLPIYPLDGGQILRSLLWYPLGRARSLMVAAVFGVIGAAAFVVWAIAAGSLWMAIIAGFVLLNCWGGMKAARALSQMAKLPRREGYACPVCNTPPPVGSLWKCTLCQAEFDTFQCGAVCPVCSAHFDVTRCPDCGRSSPISQWAVAGVTAAGAGPSS